AYAAATNLSKSDLEMLLSHQGEHHNPRSVSSTSSVSSDFVASVGDSNNDEYASDDNETGEKVKWLDALTQLANEVHAAPPQRQQLSVSTASSDESDGDMPTLSNASVLRNSSVLPTRPAVHLISPSSDLHPPIKLQTPRRSKITASMYEGATTSAQARPKVYVHKACINCKVSHVACDVARPCQRCVRLGKGDSCIDAERKKRGRPSNAAKKGMLEAAAAQALANEQRVAKMGADSAAATAAAVAAAAAAAAVTANATAEKRKGRKGGEPVAKRAKKVARRGGGRAPAVVGVPGVRKRASVGKFRDDDSEDDEPAVMSRAASGSRSPVDSVEEDELIAEDARDEVVGGGHALNALEVSSSPAELEHSPGDSAVSVAPALNTAFAMQALMQLGPNHELMQQMVRTMLGSILGDGLTSEETDQAAAMLLNGSVDPFGSGGDENVVAANLTNLAFSTFFSDPSSLVSLVAPGTAVGGDPSSETAAAIEEVMAAVAQAAAAIKDAALGSIVADAAREAASDAAAVVVEESAVDIVSPLGAGHELVQGLLTEEGGEEERLIRRALQELHGVELGQLGMG
ncbi:hypothetical protein HK101_004410, partial [Irineochytrium annulatum]